MLISYINLQIRGKKIKWKHYYSNIVNMYCSVIYHLCTLCCQTKRSFLSDMICKVRYVHNITWFLHVLWKFVIYMQYAFNFPWVFLYYIQLSRLCLLCVTMSRSVIDNIRVTATNHMYNRITTITKYPFLW